MESTGSKNEFGLLPHYCKKIGLVIMVSALALALLGRFFKVDNMLFRDICLNTAILGLLFFGWSKDKAEDEMTIALRFHAIAETFRWAVLFVIVMSVLEMLSKEPIQEIGGRALMMGLLLMYVSIYYLTKRAR